MPAARRDLRWETALVRESRFRRLGAEMLVFNPVRWETRLLTSLSAAVFEMLLRSPATEEEITAGVAALLPAGASSAEMRGRVREVMEELHRFDLVRPCAGAPDATR